MTGAPERYIESMRNHFGYIPTMPPGDDVRLGDVGVFENGTFVRKSHLDHFGIEFEERRDDSTVTYTYGSGSGVNIEYKAKGEAGTQFTALADVDAGARVTFSDEELVLFSATGCREPEIDDKSRVKRELLELVADDSSIWRDNYTVVTDKLIAESVTVLISSSAGGAVELRARGDADSFGRSVGELSIGMEIAYSENMMWMTVSETEITPLFRALRPDRSLLERILGAFPQILPSNDPGFSLTGSPSMARQSSRGSSHVEEETISAEECERLVDCVYCDPLFGQR